MDIKWIKITTDIFDDEKILLIESLPDADAIIVIWFKLLCLAGKQNNSGVFLMNDRIPYTEKMLATIFRRKETTVQLALQTFEQFGMVEIVDGVITIPNWEKHQNIDGMEKIREQTRQRVAKHREKQRLLLDTNSECNVTGNATVTFGNATDKDKDKDKNKNINNIMSENVREIVNYLNEKAGTKYRPGTEDTKKHIRARLSEGFTVEDFKKVIDKKVKEWTGTDMEMYLRPQTLFGTKFESYLNAKGGRTRYGANGVKLADSTDEEFFSISTEEEFDASIEDVI